MTARNHMPLRVRLSLNRFFACNEPAKDRLSGWRLKDAIARSRCKTRAFPMRGMINRCLERTQRTGRPL